MRIIQVLSNSIMDCFEILYSIPMEVGLDWIILNNI